MGTTWQMYGKLLRSDTPVPAHVLRAAFAFTPSLDACDRDHFLAQLCRQPLMPVDLLQQLVTDRVHGQAVITHPALSATDRIAAITSERREHVRRDLLEQVDDPEVLAAVADKLLTGDLPDADRLLLTLLAHPSLPVESAHALLAALEADWHGRQGTFPRESRVDAAATALAAPGVAARFLPTVRCASLLRDLIQRLPQDERSWLVVTQDLLDRHRPRPQGTGNQCCAADEWPSLLELVATSTSAPAPMRKDAADELVRLWPGDLGARALNAHLHGRQDDLTRTLLAELERGALAPQALLAVVDLLPGLAPAIAAHPDCRDSDLYTLTLKAPRTPEIFAAAFQTHPNVTTQAKLVCWLGPTSWPLVTVEPGRVLAELTGLGVPHDACATLFAGLADSDRLRMPWPLLSKLLDQGDVAAWVAGQLDRALARPGSARLFHEVVDAFEGTFDDMLVMLTGVCEPAVTASA